MVNIDNALRSAIHQLSDDNYAHSLAFCRLWFDIGQTHDKTASDRIFDAILLNRGTGSSMIDPSKGKLIHSTAHLIVRFASDIESDHLLSPHNSGLQSRLCARTLREFFDSNVGACGGNGIGGNICVDANLIAHWANLGYVEEAVIRNHILQSLISHPKLFDHQADALVILFNLAGATFEAYADPSVIDRCFELLKDHRYHNQDLETYNANPGYWHYPGYVEMLNRGNSYDLMKKELVQVRALRPVKGGHRAKPNPQEVVALRERGWEGLPPPPTFMTGKPKPSGPNQEDPAATPVATSLGLPSRNLELQIPPSQPPPLEFVTAPESGTIPTSPVTSVTQSPSISIATLSDFAITDTDDQSIIDPTVADASDDELSVDLTTTAPHETLYFEDGNAEVLCGNSLFRVHTTILSLHSPVLRWTFTQANLAAAESPNGCPRILTSDTPEDFATLLKTIYLPGFGAPPPCR